MARKPKAAAAADAARRFATPLAFRTDLLEAARPDDAACAGGGPAPEGRVRPGFMEETNLGGTIEDIPGLDRARIMTGGLFAAGATSLRRPPPPRTRPHRDDAPDLELVFGGGDPWTAVPDTTLVPWRSVCHLAMQFDAGTGSGTAWFVSRDTLITAGHNLLHPQFGWAREVVITPGKNGTAVNPYGSGFAVQGDVHPDWKATGGTRREADIGYLRINDPGIGQRLGWFGLRVLSRHELETGNLIVHSAGYPYLKPHGTQWADASRIAGFTDAFIFYRLDTEMGNSGGPIFATFADGQRQVVACHTHGTAERASNAGLRITDAVFDLIQGWTG